MRSQRSIPVAIAQDADLVATVREFTRLKVFAGEACRNGGGKPLSQVDLHRAAYESLKGTLSSQMTCSVFRCVAAAYVSCEKSLRKSNVRRAKAGRPLRERHPVKFDRPSALFLIGDRGRDASFRSDGTLSMSTVAGRKRVAYSVPEKFRGRFESAVSYDSITVTMRDGRLIANMAVTLDLPEPAGHSPVGIDLNANLLVVAMDADDNGFVFSGKETKVLNRRTRQTKRRLRKKVRELKARSGDTRSVRRVLERLGTRESNRTKDTCRVAAKRLVEWLPEDAIVVLEELNIKPKLKAEHDRKPSTRRKLNSFPHRQLRVAIESKCQDFGFPVATVNPYLTSQRCSRCGALGVRKLDRFECSCGYREHADINAARNIRDLYKLVGLRSDGVQVSHPRSPHVGGKLLSAGRTTSNRESN